VTQNLPAIFGKYRLEQFLGGGMSHVYRATDTVLNRTVCVKILTVEGAADRDTRERFLAEAKMSAALVHDNVIRIFDYGEEQGRPFIVMEFLTGSDLRKLVDSGAAGGFETRLKYAWQAARALEYVHSQGVVHRDIKPDNLHVDSEGRVRLMDFGVAKTADLNLTKTGFQVGTPYYMAPEQVMGDAPTPRVDIYAFGILLFEIFTGRRAVQGTTIEQLFYQILHAPLDLTPLEAACVPRKYIDLIARMTAKDPNARPESFSEVVAALEAPGPASAPAAQPVERQQAAARGISGKYVVAGLMGLVLVLGGTFIYLTLTNKNKIQDAVKQMKINPPVLEDAAGAMVLVRGGPFLAGAEKQQKTLGDFYIDRTEVTVGAYRAYCERAGRPKPAGLEAAQPELPVTGVTILEAKDFCAAAGKRLPTALEWEKAGRGPMGYKYPWGDEENAERTAVGGKPMAPAASLTASTSPFGAIGMSGNVWEWVDQPQAPSPQAIASFAALLNPPPTASEPWYQAKGGSHLRPLPDAVLWEFISLPARFSAPDIGFRCAKDPAPVR
jgi:serine/threonine-protein kinase